MYKSYYLQQMGIDIWKIRDVKSKQKVLVIISKEELSVTAKRLLDNMLLSTKLKLEDYERLYVDASTNIEKIEMGSYKAVVVVGDVIHLSSRESNDGIQIIRIFHPNHLLSSPIDKSKAYMALRKLEIDYV